jgi:hypothetical protein
VLAAVIARLTLSDALRQGVTWLALALALALLALTGLFGMFNFEAVDRMRMASTAGLALALALGVVLAALHASLGIHRELADRTALTLFAKPVGRGAYLIGKAAGVTGTALVASLVVALAHAGLLALGAATGFAWGGDHGHEDPAPVPWRAVAAGHVLVLCHTACIASLATALAPRLGLAANLGCCAAAFVLGHLLPGLGPVPALAAFQIDDAVQATGLRVDAAYLGWAGLYTGLFCAGCTVIGVAAFARQDIR